jgi:Holliday junction resolvase RusA-like endonuclease
VITIEVRGLPAPQGSKRHVGRGIMVESSKAVGPWREAVRAETQRALESILFAGRDLPPTGGPMAMTVTFYLPRPKSHYRTGRNAHLLRESAPTFPAGRPDLDKLVRALLDGLTAGGVWQDDSQVVQLAVGKDYGEPGAIITIDRLEEG